MNLIIKKTENCVLKSHLDVGLFSFSDKNKAQRKTTDVTICEETIPSVIAKEQSNAGGVLQPITLFPQKVSNSIEKAISRDKAIQLFKLIKEYGKDMNEVDGNGNTPLIILCKEVKFQLAHSFSNAIFINSPRLLSLRCSNKVSKELSAGS